MPDTRRDDEPPRYARDWDPQGLPRPGQAPDHERRSRTSPVGVLGVVGLMALIGVLIHFALGALLGSFARHQASWARDPQYLSSRTNGLLTVPPAPRLQIAPEDDLAAVRAQEGAMLTTYGWADRSRGIVRLPIERAKVLLLQRGLPHAPGASHAPRPDALPKAPFPNNGVLLGGETPLAEGGPERGS